MTNFIRLFHIQNVSRYQFKIVADKLKVIDMVESIVVKGENAGYQHFLLSPQCFQKAFLPKVVKTTDGWAKG